jgi:hypothetical protein
LGLASKFSNALPVELVASGGWLVRQVDGNGVALDDGVTVYSVAKPVVVVSSAGVTEDLSATYSIHRQITTSPTGHPVVRVDGSGAVVLTPFSGGTSISSPTLTQTSTAGSSPFTWDETVDATDFAGLRRRLQIASDSGFTTLLYDLYKPLLESEINGNDAIWGSGTDNPPRDYTSDVITYLGNLSGSIYVRERLERDDGVTSTWSNVLHDTLPVTPISTPNLTAWYDPSDLSTLFQDTAGTVPVTADGQTVALMKDKSGHGNDLSQATVGNRPTYHTAAGKSWLTFAPGNKLQQGNFASLGTATIVAAMNIPTYSAFRQFMAETFGATDVNGAFAFDQSNLWGAGAHQIPFSTSRWFANKVATTTVTTGTPVVYAADGTGRAAGAITMPSGVTFGDATVGCNLYGLVFAGSSDTQILSDADRHTVEDYLASKSGAY